MLVLGILLGSFIGATANKEFHIVKPPKSILIRGIVGSAMMAFGAVIAQGCLVGNGLVGTAQYSLKSWIALIFISFGIWCATYVFIKRKEQ